MHKNFSFEGGSWTSDGRSAASTTSQFTLTARWIITNSWWTEIAHFIVINISAPSSIWQQACGLNIPWTAILPKMQPKNRWSICWWCKHIVVINQSVKNDCDTNLISRCTDCQPELEVFLSPAGVYRRARCRRFFNLLPAKREKRFTHGIKN